MDPLHILILAVAGAIGGFLAGLIGVGGGVIFSPALLFYYSAIGTDDGLIAPLTLGSGLFMTLMSASSGAWTLRGQNVADARVALTTGAFAAIAVTLMVVFVTTQPWFDRRVFQAVLGTVLLAAVAKMVLGKPSESDEPVRPGKPALAATGLGAGAVASAAGVGGGIVMVPIFNQVLRMPMRTAAASSILAIVLISTAGVILYVLTGLGRETPATALGFVDVGRVIWMAIPAIVTARLGVQMAQRVKVRVIRLVFAAVAGVVAMRLLWSAFLG